MGSPAHQVQAGAVCHLHSGVLIFFDDYFNCLTVGTVMRPVTNKFKVSRAKLAYIIDSTAAPICILAPVSSWIATVMTIMGVKFAAEGIGMDPFTSFMRLIPMNLTLLALLLWVGLLFDLDFGPMAHHETMALAGRDPGVWNKRKRKQSRWLQTQKVPFGTWYSPFLGLCCLPSLPWFTLAAILMGDIGN